VILIRGARMTSSKGIGFKDARGPLSGLFAEDLHAKRVYSLAKATLRVMTAASPGVNAIGHGRHPRPARSSVTA
jgi:hypothetical protein